MMQEILQDEERRKQELAQMIEEQAKAAAEVSYPNVCLFTVQTLLST
jgi:cell division protein FtsB